MGYYRTWYGNITVTDNTLVAPGDFTSYCITAPKDALLPNGGGYPVCGLYDLSAAKVGQVSNLVTFASDRNKFYNGMDVLLNARFSGGRLLSGGFSSGTLSIGSQGLG